MFVCAGGGEGMIERSEGGCEGVVCPWPQAAYSAHSHTWQPRGTVLQIRNLTPTQPFSHPFSLSLSLFPFILHICEKFLIYYADPKKIKRNSQRTLLSKKE